MVVSTLSLMVSSLSFLVALFAVTAGIFVSSNRILFGLATGPLDKPEYAEFVQTKDDVLNYYLEKHHKQIGDDFVPYRNHCLRVLAFTRYFLAQDAKISTETEPRIHNIIAMALAYHDIALWTDKELNYLEPSAVQMNQRVQEEMKLSTLQSEGDEGTGYVPMNVHWSTLEEDAEIARAIILEHHKFTAYYDSSNNIDNESQLKKLEHVNEIVNAVRKADWADATMGIIRNGMPQSFLAAVYDAIPDEGFHNVLLNMAPRLSPDSLEGQLKVMRILKW